MSIRQATRPLTEEEIVEAVNIVAGATPITCTPADGELMIGEMVHELGLKGFTRASIQEFVAAATFLLNQRWADVAAAKAASVVNIGAVKAAEDLRIARIRRRPAEAA